MNTTKQLNTKTKTIPLILGALGCGGAAAYFTSGYIDNEVTNHKQKLDAVYEKEKVVVPINDLSAGSVITFENVVMREVPRGFLHQDVIYPENMEQIAGHQLAFPVNRGAPLLYSHISKRRGAEFSALLENGQRALTFPVDILSSLSGMLKPQDNIDLMITMKDEKKTMTFPLIENVEVMATGRSVEKLNGDTESRGYNTITLAVSARDATRIIHARTVGRLSVMLRSPGDRSPGIDRPVTINSLLGKPEFDNPKPKRQRRPAEIILGGVGK